MIKFKNKILSIGNLFTLLSSQFARAGNNVLDLINKGKKAYKKDNYN